MGIAVWRLRTDGAPLDASAPAESALAAQQRPAEPSAPAEARPAVEAQPAVEARPAVEAQPAVDARAAVEARPRSAVSLALAGVVLLLEGAGSRRELRLARDVLAAATGDWRAKPVRRRFDWPGAVGETAVPADGGPRALGAFVEKDLEDHDARLLLCEESLAALLAEGSLRCRRLVIPGLASLARDAGAKRSLWLSLVDARS